MDAILNEGLLSLFNEEIEIIKDHQSEDYEVSLWIKEKDIIRPSGSLSLAIKLDPGVYAVEYDRNLGYFCRKMDATSDELHLFSNSITNNLLAEINLFWSKKDLYKENKLIHKRGILLEGPPGTGKSSIITQLSDEIIKLGGIVFKVSSFKNLDDYVNFLRVGFKKIQPETPIITILEDIDQYGEVELQLLDFLDGKTQINHHVVIATSNNTEEIPDAFLRPSRLDLKIEIPLPNKEIRREYFEFKNVPENMIQDLVDGTEKCSLADLKEIYICIFLLDYSVEDALLKVLKPRSKKNYLTNPLQTKKLGL